MSKPKDVKIYFPSLFLKFDNNFTIHDWPKLENIKQSEVIEIDHKQFVSHITLSNAKIILTEHFSRNISPEEIKWYLRFIDGEKVRPNNVNRMIRDWSVEEKNRHKRAHGEQQPSGQTAGSPPETSIANNVPRSAEWFLQTLLPKTTRENIIGDLEEEFCTAILPKFGRHRARLWYWVQVTQSIGPIVSARLARAMLAIGTWAKLIDLLRRMSS